MQQMITIYGEIPSKKNSYRSDGKGGFFKPKDITGFEGMVAKEVMAQKVKLVEGEFTLYIRIYTKGNKHDIDNQATTLIDALQDAGVYANDKMLASYCVTRLPVETNQSVRAVVVIVEGNTLFLEPKFT